MANIDSFLKFARCSSKTYSIKQQALKELASGKTVAIISAFPDIYKHIGGRKKCLNPGTSPSKDLIDLFSLHQIISMLDGSNGLDNPLNRDLYWKDYVPFNKYDRVFVDADCYEIIIYKLQKQNFELKQKIDKNIQKLRSIIDNFERE